VPLGGGSNRIEFPEALNRRRLEVCLERANPAKAGRALDSFFSKNLILSYMEKTSIVSNRHLLVISFFGAISIIAQIWSYLVEVDISKVLFQRYNSTFPEESMTFQWAIQSTSRFSLIEIIGFGVAMFVVFYVVLWFLNDFFKKKWDGRQPIVELVIIFVYLGFLVFLITFTTLFRFTAL
jgi:hypothetical protein